MTFMGGNHLRLCHVFCKMKTTNIVAQSLHISLGIHFQKMGRYQEDYVSLIPSDIFSRLPNIPILFVRMIRYSLYMPTQVGNCPQIRSYQWIFGVLSLRYLMNSFDCFKGILKNTLVQKKRSSIFLQSFHRLLHAIKRPVRYSILKKIGLALPTMKTKRVYVNQFIDSFRNESIRVFFFKNILMWGYF